MHTFSQSAMTRHKGGGFATCQADKVTTPGFTCQCGKHLHYNGIAIHRSKCRKQMRKIVFDTSTDRTFLVGGPSPVRLTSAASTSYTTPSSPADPPSPPTLPPLTLPPPTLPPPTQASPPTRPRLSSATIHTDSEKSKFACKHNCGQVRVTNELKMKWKNVRFWSHFLNLKSLPYSSVYLKKIYFQIALVGRLMNSIWYTIQ